MAWTYLDLNAFPDLHRFAGAMAGSAAKALENNTDRLLKIFSGFRRLRPKLEMGSDGSVAASLETSTWETAGKSRVIAPEIIERLPLIIARQDSPHYEMIWQSATKSQKNLLIALSDDPKGLLFSREFQLSHGIGPSSSIKASLDSLLKKGILAKALEGGYVFVDEFMPFWIKDIRKSKGTFTPRSYPRRDPSSAGHAD